MEHYVHLSLGCLYILVSQGFLLHIRWRTNEGPQRCTGTHNDSAGSGFSGAVEEGGQLYYQSGSSGERQFLCNALPESHLWVQSLGPDPAEVSSEGQKLDEGVFLQNLFQESKHGQEKFPNLSLGSTQVKTQINVRIIGRTQEFPFICPLGLKEQSLRYQYI